MDAIGNDLKSLVELASSLTLNALLLYLWVSERAERRLVQEQLRELLLRMSKA